MSFPASDLFQSLDGKVCGMTPEESELLFASIQRIWEGEMSEKTQIEHPADIKTNHIELDGLKRVKLVDWLFSIGEEHMLRRDTVHSAITICDRFLAVTSGVPVKCYQLVGATAMMVSSKVNETDAFSMKNMVDLCAGFYSSEMFKKSEQHMGQVLDWIFNIPTTFVVLETYLEYIRRIVGVEVTVAQKLKAYQLADAIALMYHSLSFKKSTLAISIIIVLKIVSINCVRSLTDCSEEGLERCVCYLDVLAACIPKMTDKVEHVKDFIFTESLKSGASLSIDPSEWEVAQIRNPALAEIIADHYNAILNRAEVNYQKLVTSRAELLQQQQQQVQQQQQLQQQAEEQQQRMRVAIMHQQRPSDLIMMSALRESGGLHSVSPSPSTTPPHHHHSHQHQHHHHLTSQAQQMDSLDHLDNNQQQQEEEVHGEHLPSGLESSSFEQDSSLMNHGSEGTPMKTQYDHHHHHVQDHVEDRSGELVEQMHLKHHHHMVEATSDGEFIDIEDMKMRNLKSQQQQQQQQQQQINLPQMKRESRKRRAAEFPSEDSISMDSL